MKKTLMRLSIPLIASIFLTSCGRYPWDTTTTSQYSLDGVKRISEGLASENSSTWGQQTFPINSTSRLLLRFETLKDHLQTIITTNGKTVNIQLTLTDATKISVALTDLKLCPVTRSWMMLASWEFAHPFMGGDRWATNGGDYELAGCVNGTQVSGSTTSITYDVTTWYLNYPKGRGYNYGVIALSTESFEIHGDQSGSYSPRISFQE